MKQCRTKDRATRKRWSIGVAANEHGIVNGSVLLLDSANTMRFTRILKCVGIARCIKTERQARVPIASSLLFTSHLYGAEREEEEERDKFVARRTAQQRENGTREKTNVFSPSHLWRAYTLTQ